MEHPMLKLSRARLSWPARLPALGRSLPLVALLVCAACSTSATLSAQPPRQLAGGPWEQVSLPTPPADIQSVTMSPANPATLLACAAHLVAPEGPGSAPPAPMTLWRTADAGAHWTRSPLALGSGIACYIAFAPDAPRRVVLQVTRGAQGTQPCASDAFYLSDDGGATWRQLPRHTSIAPADVSFGWCDLRVTQRHLFIVYSFAPSSQMPQISMMERSDDEGAHWVRADHGLGDGALFFTPAIGPGETLAMTVLHLAARPAPVPTQFWTSADAGRTWREMGILPEYPGTILLAAPPQPGGAWPTPAYPFYALEQEQIPSDLYRTRVLASGDGQRWTLLPPLPVAGVSNERRGILQALTALPDGRLAVWGPDPRTGLPAPDAIAEPMSAFWLWLWDPRAQQWQALPSPLLATASERCGLCWDRQTASASDGSTYVYVGYFLGGPDGQSPPGLFRVRLARTG
jgi:hypothetical protein